MWLQSFVLNSGINKNNKLNFTHFIYILPNGLEFILNQNGCITLKQGVNHFNFKVIFHSGKITLLFCILNGMYVKHFKFQGCFPQWGIYKTMNGFMLPLSITSHNRGFCYTLKLGLRISPLLSYTKIDFTCLLQYKW